MQFWNWGPTPIRHNMESESFFLSSKSLHPSVHCVQWRPTCFNWNTKHTVPAAEGANVEGEESGGAKSRAKLCKKVGWYSES